MDAIAGLLHLRERQPFTIYGSERVLLVLQGQSDLPGCSPKNCVHREVVGLELPFEPRYVDGQRQWAADRAVRRPGQGGALPGAQAIPRMSSPASRAMAVGVEVRADGKRLLYIPGCAEEMTEVLEERLAGASVVLFDGTRWQDDEMIRRGLAPRQESAWDT